MYGVAYLDLEVYPSSTMKHGGMKIVVSFLFSNTVLTSSTTSPKTQKLPREFLCFGRLKKQTALLLSGNYFIGPFYVIRLLTINKNVSLKEHY